MIDVIIVITAQPAVENALIPVENVLAVLAIVQRDGAFIEVYYNIVRLPYRLGSACIICGVIQTPAESQQGKQKNRT